MPEPAGRRRFEGRVCLVTGGGRGIGRGIALGLAAEGARVAVAARTAAQCEAVAAELGSTGLAVPLDVTDEQACVDAVARVRAELGPLDAVVTAAGISPVHDRIERHDVGAWRDIVDVNLTGTFLVARAAAADLIERRGTLLMISSAGGVAATPRFAGYGATKAALVHLTRTMAVEWAPHGVRVNALCPGYAETELTRSVLDDERRRAAVIAHTPLGRLAAIDEIVAPALFLLSDEASYVTGAALLVDGGMAT